MARKEREILEHAVGTLAEQAVEADELVDEATAARRELVRLREQLVERRRSLLLHSGEHVRVGIKRDADGGVTETLGDDHRVYALLQHQRGVGVAKVMEPDVGKTGAPKEAPPARGERVGVERRSIATVDHDVVVHPGPSRLAPTANLIRVLTLEVRPKELRQHDRTTRPSRLRMLIHQTGPRGLDASPDMGDRAILVQI